MGTDEAIHLLSKPAVKDEQAEGKTLSNSPRCPKVIRYVADVVNLCSSGGLRPGREWGPAELCTCLSAVNPEASSQNCTHNSEQGLNGSRGTTRLAKKPVGPIFLNLKLCDHFFPAFQIQVIHLTFRHIINGKNGPARTLLHSFS